MFLGCDFKTNVYCTFKSHKNRKHCNHTLADFKPGVVITRLTSVYDKEADSQECVENPDSVIPSSSRFHTEDLKKVIERRFAVT